MTEAVISNVERATDRQRSFDAIGDAVSIRTMPSEVPQHLGQQSFELANAFFPHGDGGIVAGPLPHECPVGAVLGEQFGQVALAELA